MSDLFFRAEDLLNTVRENEASWEIEVEWTIDHTPPAVDAVEVVRCSSCKYHNKAPCPMRLSLNWTEDNDFCSYGERKRDDG